MSGSGEGSRFVLERVEELLERAGELLDALAVQGFGDVVVVHASASETVDERPGLREVVFETGFGLSVVVVLLDGFFGHRVDGVGADQLLDVDGVGVVGVLGGG